MNEAESYFQRAIGDVEIYGRVLTYEEIARLHFLFRWYCLSWWQRLWFMAKETWFILTRSKRRDSFDFWWTSYNRTVYTKNKQ